MIKNVDELVKALGGLKPAADAFKVGKPSICNWKKGGRLPAWAMVRATELAGANRLVLDPKVLQAKKPKPRRSKAA